MDHPMRPPLLLLTPEQIHTYLRDGILVVNNLLSATEIIEAQIGLASTLKQEYGVDVHDLEATGHKLVDASSTNGAGGVLDIFYPEWKLKIATNETLFRMTCQLWKEAYCHSGEVMEDLLFSSTESNIDIGDNNDDDDKIRGALHSNSVKCDNDHIDIQTKGEGPSEDVSFKWHPFGAFDVNKGYMYIDRIGYRIPTKLAESIGKQISITASFQESPMHVTTTTPAPTTTTSPSPPATAAAAAARTYTKGTKPRPLQRSLTPHFDCCPENYHDASNKTKWRPIQCFVSLTDNLQPNTGGFEACPGFHREFRSWVESGRRRRRHDKQQQQSFDSGNSFLEGSDSSGGDGGGISRQSTEKNRIPTKQRQSKQKARSQQQQKQQPPLCVGEYTHVSPSLDRDIMQRMQHIPVRAGSAVFWDNRIPHGNSYRNDPPPPTDDDCDDSGGVVVVGGDSGISGMGSSKPLGSSGARAVVYCSFLPDVEVNRRFVARQLEDWKIKRPPRVGDRWIRQDNEAEGTIGSSNSDGNVDGNNKSTGDDDEDLMEMTDTSNLSELGKKLLGLVEWPDTT